MSSKRVEFVEDTVNQLQHEEKLSPRLKRKNLELTEHQKEVRRAQQGRERDCSGHGSGIRTCTSVDFSQGNEDSQESQESRIHYGDVKKSHLIVFICMPCFENWNSGWGTQLNQAC